LKVLNLKKTEDNSTREPSETSVASIRDKLAKSLRDNGQRDEAIGVLQQLVKENPLRFETYELLAELFEEKGDIEGALANYQQVLLLDSAQPMNYLRVADMQLRLKRFDKAVATLAEAREKF